MVSLSLVNLARLLETYLVVHSWPFDLGTVKALGAGIVASAVAVALRALLGPGTVALVVCVIGLAVAYLGTTVALGLEPREAAAVRALRRR
jgi:hypothetical protein